ncbi:MAG: hypothetical protein O2897_03185 [bacterium]|nr:hypothetical protein [bacterium]
MKMLSLLLVVCGFSINAMSYNFICNSYDADGNKASDNCGVCNDETAARWIPGDIALYLDENTVPSGITKSSWTNLFLSSLDSWNRTPDANVKIHQIGTAQGREFGSDNTHHEVFWILDVLEWQKKIGSGINDTLGVTLSPYTCASAVFGTREIFDADLVMNGASKDFRWRESCSSPTNCDSIRSTLTHELGHVLGLGHTIIAISSKSIMSAKSGYQIEFPLFDDQEAVRALYPGEFSGQLGSRCDKSSDCLESQCISQEDAHFCSRSCAGQTSCPNGFSCADNGIDAQMCVFSSGRFAGAMGIGDSCVDKLCEVNLICAGVDAQNVFCFEPCSSTNSCQADEKCIPLENQADQGVCMRIASLGEDCSPESPCGKNLFCVVNGENQGKCRVPCDLKKSKQCGIGEKCYDLGKGKGACIGGNIDAGNSPTKPEVPVNNSTCSCTSSLPNSFGGQWSGMLAVLLLAGWFMGRRVSGFLR